MLTKQVMLPLELLICSLQIRSERQVISKLKCTKISIKEAVDHILFILLVINYWKVQKILIPPHSLQERYLMADLNQIYNGFRLIIYSRLDSL